MSTFELRDWAWEKVCHRLKEELACEVCKKQKTDRCLGELWGAYWGWRLAVCRMCYCFEDLEKPLKKAKRRGRPKFKPDLEAIN